MPRSPAQLPQQPIVESPAEDRRPAGFSPCEGDRDFIPTRRVASSRELHQVGGGVTVQRRPLMDVGTIRMKWSLRPASSSYSPVILGGHGFPDAPLAPGLNMPVPADWKWRGPDEPHRHIGHAVAALAAGY